MRGLFFALLCANLLFLAWARWVDGPREPSEQDPLSHVPRLQLVTEAPPAPKPTSGAAQKMAFRKADPVPGCTSVGPFSDLTSTARVAGLLASHGFRLRQRAEEGDTIEGYWVFVGGMQSDDEVTRVVERLGKSGFTDAHIMKNVSSNRRVSVGMFTTRERAERRAAAVRRMGLEAEIGERKFPGTVYWVDVMVAPGLQQLPPEYAFAEVGRPKVGMEPCPTPLKSPEPGVTELPEADEGVGALPRTTIASAPKSVP